METSDPNRRMVQLDIAGRVENIVTINPPRVSLSGQAGDTIRQSVQIVPEERYAFKILEARANSGVNITYTLEVDPGAGRPAYKLLVENRKTDKGRYYDVINLKTDSPLRPEIKVTVYGNIVETPAAPPAPQGKQAKP